MVYLLYDLIQFHLCTKMAWIMFYRPISYILFGCYMLFLWNEISVCISSFECDLHSEVSFWIHKRHCLNMWLILILNLIPSSEIREIHSEVCSLNFAFGFSDYLIAYNRSKFSELIFTWGTKIYSSFDLVGIFIV